MNKNWESNIIHCLEEPNDDSNSSEIILKKIKNILDSNHCEINNSKEKTKQKVSNQNVTENISKSNISDSNVDFSINFPQNSENKENKKKEIISNFSHKKEKDFEKIEMIFIDEEKSKEHHFVNRMKIEFQKIISEEPFLNNFSLNDFFTFSFLDLEEDPHLDINIKENIRFILMLKESKSIDSS